MWLVRIIVDGVFDEYLIHQVMCLCLYSPQFILTMDFELDAGLRASCEERTTTDVPGAS